MKKVFHLRKPTSECLGARNTKVFLSIKGKTDRSVIARNTKAKDNIVL